MNCDYVSACPKSWFITVCACFLQTLQHISLLNYSLFHSNLTIGVNQPSVFFIEIVHRKRRTVLFKNYLQWMNAIKGSIDSWNSCILPWMQLRQARWMFGHLNLSVFLVHFTITSVSWEPTILDKIWIHGDFLSMNGSILHRIGSIS